MHSREHVQIRILLLEEGILLQPTVRVHSWPKCALLELLGPENVQLLLVPIFLGSHLRLQREWLRHSVALKLGTQAEYFCFSQRLLFHFLFVELFQFEVTSKSLDLHVPVHSCATPVESLRLESAVSDLLVLCLSPCLRNFSLLLLELGLQILTKIFAWPVSGLCLHITVDLWFERAGLGPLVVDLLFQSLLFAKAILRLVQDAHVGCDVA